MSVELPDWTGGSVWEWEGLGLRALGVGSRV